MRKPSFYMLSFNSTHDAIQAEKILEAHFPVQVIPTLRSVSESCGISLRVEEEEYPLLQELLDAETLSKGHFTLYHVRREAEQRELLVEQLLP
ncbi:MAG: DUF3343 domain-containing protein [Bacillota bacterium]|nr:DUF3343 domain-containing protein [Bacillota bacterium]